MYYGHFLPHELVERIMIINNSSKENLFNIDAVLPHYRSLDAYVTVIRRRDSRLARTAQLLKLEVAKRVPVPSDFFERPDGTLRTFLENYTLHLMRKTLENVAIHPFGLWILN